MLEVVGGKFLLPDPANVDVWRRLKGNVFLVQKVVAKCYLHWDVVETYGFFPHVVKTFYGEGAWSIRQDHVDASPSHAGRNALATKGGGGTSVLVTPFDAEVMQKADSSGTGDHLGVFRGGVEVTQ